MLPALRGGTCLRTLPRNRERKSGDKKLSSWWDSNPWSLDYEVYALVLCYRCCPCYLYVRLKWRTLSCWGIPGFETEVLRRLPTSFRYSKLSKEVRQKIMFPETGATAEMIPQTTMSVSTGNPDERIYLAPDLEYAMIPVTDASGHTVVQQVCLNLHWCVFRLWKSALARVGGLNFEPGIFWFSFSSLQQRRRPLGYRSPVRI